MAKSFAGLQFGAKHQLKDAGPMSFVEFLRDIVFNQVELKFSSFSIESTSQLSHDST